MSLFQPRLICTLLLALLYHSSIVHQVSADESAPFVLTVEPDLKEIPPLIPVYLILRLENVSETVFPVTGFWADSLCFRIQQGKTLLHEIKNANRFYDHNVNPFHPNAELVYVHQWNHNSLKEALFVEPGCFSIQVGCYSPDLYDEKTNKIMGAQYELQAKSLSVLVRAPTEEEQGAIELLQNDAAALQMFYGRDRNEQACETLQKLADQFPQTIYADFANFQLGRMGIFKNTAGYLSELETYRARVKHLEQVGKASPLLHQQATFLKYVEMTERPRSFPDVDWKAAVQELEALEPATVALGLEKLRKKRTLPYAQALAKDGKIDPENLP